MCETLSLLKLVTVIELGREGGGNDGERISLQIRLMCFSYKLALQINFFVALIKKNINNLHSGSFFQLVAGNPSKSGI